jgi:hypothetical protein
VTPGTQGALFLAVASTVTTGDRVAIVRPESEIPNVDRY